MVGQINELLHCRAMAVYKTDGSTPPVLAEVPLFGSDRLGMLRKQSTNIAEMVTEALSLQVYTGSVYVIAPGAEVVLTSGFAADKSDGQLLYIGSDISQAPSSTIPEPTQDATHARVAGFKSYELKDHLSLSRYSGSNVRATVSDEKNADNTPQILMAANYYPFGMEMPYQNFNFSSYRYGFNGKEKDTDGEIGGSLTTYDYGFRIYSPTIGKFLSVDPLTTSYPMLTPYQFASNRPIDGIDLDGLEYATYMIYFQGGKKVKTTLVNHTKLEKGYGSQGPGVAYVKVKLNIKGKIESQEQVKFIKNDYGIYAGADPNNPQNSYRFNGIGYDYNLPAIDATDQAAKDHDMEYDAVNAVGENDFWDNPFTIEADQRAVDAWNKVSGDGATFRWKATTLFNKVIGMKKLIAAETYLKDHGNDNFRHSNQLNNEIRKLGGLQKVYEMWRNENMKQGDDGIWRKKG